MHALLSFSILCALTVSGTKASTEFDSSIATAQDHTEAEAVPDAHRRLSSSDYAGAKRSIGEIDKFRLGKLSRTADLCVTPPAQVCLWAWC